MKFVVTGGAGFIGSHLTKFLLENGHNVIVIDNLARGSLENLRKVESKIEFHKISILEYDKLKEIVKDVDGVFHEAALASVPDSFKDPEKYFEVNATGTENILKLAKEFGFKVVFASSSSIYGDQTKFPIQEDAVRKPLNPYGESKLQAEKFAEQYAKDGVKVIGLRYFNVFGIGQNPNYAGVIPRFIARLEQKKPPIIEGDGSQLRSFTYVDDVVKANFLAFKSNVDHALINIATGSNTSINELAKIIIGLSGLSLQPIYDKPRKGDIHTSYANVTLAKKLFRWSPETSLQEGLKKIFPRNN